MPDVTETRQLYDPQLTGSRTALLSSVDKLGAGLARYAGCDLSVLKRLEKEGRLTLPKPLTHKQRRKRNKVDWAKTLGNIRTW